MGKTLGIYRLPGHGIMRAFHITGPLWKESTGRWLVYSPLKWLVMQSFDICLVVSQNELLDK